MLHSAVYFVFLFWFFRYLIDGRGFTLLASGLWGSLPSIAGFVCVPIFGAATDRLGRRIGVALARRRVAVGCLLAAAVCVAAGALVPGAGLAVAALSVASACVNGAEAPFFMTATAIGVRHPGTASGILNLMGNVGGVLSIWLVPHMAEAWGWIGTLGFWSAMCVGAAGLWLTIGVDDTPQPVGAAAAAACWAATRRAVELPRPPGEAAHRGVDVVVDLEHHLEFQHRQQMMAARRQVRQAHRPALRRQPLRFGHEHADAGAVDVGDPGQIDDNLAAAGGDELIDVTAERQVAVVERDLARQRHHGDVIVLDLRDLQFRRGGHSQLRSIAICGRS
jgi:MFS family permease